MKGEAGSPIVKSGKSEEESIMDALKPIRKKELTRTGTLEKRKYRTFWQREQRREERRGEDVDDEGVNKGVFDIGEGSEGYAYWGHEGCERFSRILSGL